MLLANVDGYIFFEDDTGFPLSSSVGVTTFMNKHGLSRQQLADITGAPLSVIGRWIAGSSIPPQYVLVTLFNYRPKPKQVTPRPRHAPPVDYEVEGEIPDLFIQRADTKDKLEHSEAIQGILHLYQLTPQQLASTLGVSTATVYRWRDGSLAIQPPNLARLQEYLLLNFPPSSALPAGARLDINRVLSNPIHRQRAKGSAPGYRQLVVNYKRVHLNPYRVTYPPVLSATWTATATITASTTTSKRTCTVRTLLTGHPTHNLESHNGRAEETSDRAALEAALRAAGYRLNPDKRPISQLLYIARHLVSPVEPSALTITCHRCQHQHPSKHPFVLYDGGPVRPSHIPDFMR